MSTFDDVFKNFNDTVNPVLHSFYDNPILRGVLYIVLMLYGSLAAPNIPVSWGPVMAHFLTRIGIMALIVWTASHDVLLSILIAVGWMLTMNYLTKNALKQVDQTGIVNNDVAILISGDAQKMQESVDASRSSQTAQQSTTQAVNTSGPPSTSANAGIPSVPSGTPANVPTMTATTPSGGNVPLALLPDHVQNLAAVPAV